MVGAALDVDPNNDLAIIESLILLHGLLTETEKILSSIEGIDHSKYLRNFPQLKRALLTTNLDADSRGFSTFSNALSPVVLQTVEFCAERVSENFKEEVIPHEELEEVDAQIASTFDFITGANLEPRLKELALDLLATLRSAIADYRIRGLRGLEASIEVSIGRLHLYYLREKKEGRTPPMENLRRVLDLILKLENLVAKAQSYIPALPAFIENLKMLTG